MTARTLLRNGLLCVVAIIVAIGLLEAALRAYQSVKWNTSFWGAFGGPDQNDELLGWKPKAFHSFDMDTVDNSGNAYNIQYKTYKYGFREWQDKTQEPLTSFLSETPTREQHQCQMKKHITLWLSDITRWMCLRLEEADTVHYRSTWSLTNTSRKSTQISLYGSLPLMISLTTITSSIKDLAEL
jgi:hypothetical protein